ncbi:amidohydrolase family protein [Salarchaeum sp. JOR-1]|uniref:amidohydrolase family protein n=1 Tax=Salarchaeum sp. JOR-1 TaxID=2599399 RepID=UPI00143DE859|nr:amidohydrolase family protein [Salarchaeum sp. JOR-1]
MDPDADPAGDAYPDCEVVDAHVHLLPDDLLNAVYGWFGAETEWQIPTPDAATARARIRERTDGFVCFPYAHRPGVAQEMNEWVGRALADDPACVALGTVHAGDDDPRAVVRDAFDRGLAGIKLHCVVQGYPPDDPRLDSVYEELVARDAPLVIHASTHPFDRGDSTLAPERFANVLDRFPALRACVPHLGLFDTPGFLDLVDEYDVVVDTAVALGPASRTAADINGDDLPTARLREHADSVLFGTDYPIRPAAYADALRGARECFDSSDHEAVFAGNARDFFDLY